MNVSPEEGLFFKQNGIMLYGICRFLMGNKLDR